MRLNCIAVKETGRLKSVAGAVPWCEEKDKETRLGEWAHMGEKNSGIWDSQIWDPRYLVALFLFQSMIEAFKFFK